MVGGTTVPESNHTVLYGGAVITETLTTNARFAASTSGGPLGAPVTLTLYATSLDDANLFATINVVLTN